MRILLVSCIVFIFSIGVAQPPQVDTSDFTIAVVNEKQQPFEGATIELVHGKNTLIKAAVSDVNGQAVFQLANDGQYTFRISASGYAPQTTPVYTFPFEGKPPVKITLQSTAKVLGGVTVNSRKPFIQHLRGKVIVNVDAGVTNAGTTVLEVLEKSPGVTVDKNGTISLKAKQGVIVMIDDKQTYLSGTDLANMLNSMNSSHVDIIELITNPSAKYDASGNSGIINIKTKKNRQTGFNGTSNLTLSEGRFPKVNTSLLMNYRNGKFNSYLNYSYNYNKNFLSLYGYRRYLDNQENVLAILDQPTMLTRRNHNNTLRAGLDFYASEKTTIGFAVNGAIVKRPATSTAVATWLNSAGLKDSAVETNSTSLMEFFTGGSNINLKHSFNKKSELTVNIDGIVYDIVNTQHFESYRHGTSHVEGSRGDIPTTIKILSGKADHLFSSGDIKIESGIKASRIKTDNLATYYYYDGQQWKDDLNKTNHFIYTENIKAIYTSFEHKIKKLSYQAGLRYEYTHYDAHQLGNAIKRDSAFSRSYGTVFPSGYISYELDSSNSISFTAGRRIDRPPFQKLNPFIFIYNKYTYQRGNPYMLPQLTWNMELSHQYKQLLTITLSYSILKNYFSQIFLTDTSDILIYTDGNVGRTHNFGASISVQASPWKWWSFTGTGLMNYKKLKGFLGNDYVSDIKQLHFSLNNQFTFAKHYTGELSGLYTSRSRNDIQEVVYPTGQISAGISRTVLKKKGTIRFTARDIFWSHKMEGFTDFDKADEYFMVKWDTRVFNIGFTYRFGKPLKAARRNQGGAMDEMERVGTGN